MAPELSRRQWLGGALATGVASSLAAGCRPAAEPPRDLNIGVWSEPSTFDPRLVSSPIGIQVASALFTGLVDLDPAGQIVAGVAESWNVSADGLSYVFKLRASRWTDDTPLTAEDFVYALRRLMTPRLASPAARDYSAIQNGDRILAGRLAVDRLGVRALAPDVLEIVLDRPLPALLGLLAQPAAAPTPAHVIRRHGRRWAEPGRLVGNGPYVLTAWTPGTPLLLVANPQFFDAAQVSAARIQLVPQGEPGQALAQLRAGAVHVLDGSGLPLALLASPGNLGAADVRADALWALTSLVANVRDGPLANLALRRAVSMAIQPAALIQQLLPGTPTLAATSLIPPRFPSYPEPQSPPWVTWTAEQRLNEATRLLAEAGHGPEAPLALRLRVAARDEDRALAAALDQQLRPLGIVLNVIVAAPDAHLDALAEGDFDLARRTWVAAADFPESFLALYRCDNQRSNFGGACTIEADRQADLASRLADLNERANILQRAEQLLVADVPAIPLYAPVQRTLVSRSVAGWIENPTGQHRLRWLSLAAASGLIAGERR